VPKSSVTRGGKREGAGRKPGSVSKLDAEARRKAMEGGMMPLDYLLGIMRDEDQMPAHGWTLPKPLRPIVTLALARPNCADRTAARCTVNLAGGMATFLVETFEVRQSAE
jgi:hypothetical protein